MSSLPHIIIGGGDHARVLAVVLHATGIHVLGFTDVDPDRAHAGSEGICALGTDETLMAYEPATVMLVNGIGSIADTQLRREVFDRHMQRDFRFATVIHPTARYESNVRLAEGAQLMMGCVLQTGVRIGVNTLINTATIIDHDCTIGDHCHVAPGVVLSGSVQVGARTHIGAGATVIQGIQIGEDCLIAAGAVVIHDVPSGRKMAGVPAREIDA